MGGRVDLLVTSARLPAGLLTAQAWDLVRSCPVFVADASAESRQAAALREAGVEVRPIRPLAAELLSQVATHGTVVWLAGPAGDEDLTRQLGAALVREPETAELELVYGSWDPPGARLLDAVSVVERLAAPGGDPWLAQYTESDDRSAAAARLAHYLLEEAYEAYDAIGSGEAAAVREELGDVLFQVLLHAKLAEPVEFDVDDVAGELVGKLVRRNPHVFGGVEVADVKEITRNWEQIKRSEKARTSCVDGIALSQPALALAAKILARVERAPDPAVCAAVPTAVSGSTSRDPSSVVRVPDLTSRVPDLTEKELGARLFDLVVWACASGLDAEAALRRYAIEAIEAIRRAEPPAG